MPEPNPHPQLHPACSHPYRTAQASESSVAVGVLAVLGGVLIHLACGSMYTWGNLISYVPPRLKYWDGVLPEGGGMPDASIVLPIIICAQVRVRANPNPNPNPNANPNTHHHLRAG